MSEANSQHHGAEVSLMQNALRDRSAILNSEVANLQSTIQSQKDLTSSEVRIHGGGDKIVSGKETSYIS